MDEIYFCLPVVGAGIQFAEYLVSNLLQTAVAPDRIKILLSVHNEGDRQLVQKSRLADRVHKIILAPGYQAPRDAGYGWRFVGSANHAIAVRKLAENSGEGIVVISDYDMAVLQHRWDATLERELTENDLIGVAYPSDNYPIAIPEFPYLQGLTGKKYQSLPNLSFLAMRSQCLAKYFDGQMTRFDKYLVAGGIPFRVVNTPMMAEALQLPIGTVWWMDTGDELPFVAREQNLRCKAFAPRPFSKQDVFANPEPFLHPSAQDSDTDLPEVFYDDAGIPRLAHFRRGTSKVKRGAVPTFDAFMAQVEQYLATAARLS